MFLLKPPAEGKTVENVTSLLNHLWDFPNKTITNARAARERIIKTPTI
jgi:hypothetical protein